MAQHGGIRYNHRMFQNDNMQMRLFISYERKQERLSKLVMFKPLSLAVEALNVSLMSRVID